MSTKKLSVANRLEWDTSQGATARRVEEPVTRPSHKVAASPKNPEYLRTEKSRKLAAHKSSDLRKVSR